ncbi:sensor histidine kinase [Pseudoalteromonas sp. S16_S37]|uniref:sensor histidine kinase n=1 Tax=Pseudoalteromonas sp. S16_S37 TaxID=2720228 RepID=UPI0016808390|nr:ATP-binding protein [Pseudoalteromonas sp. S16_S37]MBD1581960.1 PAS domain-containing protein [Pseudoalteromonas sp. S16_S37]
MPKHTPYEKQLSIIYLATALPLLLMLIIAMLYSQVSVWLIALCALLGAIVITWSCIRVKQKVVYQLRTQTNLIEALAQGDYTLRARAGKGEQELAPLFNAINRLAQQLSAQRWQSAESQQLVQTVLEHIDVAILAIDDNQQIALFNPAAQTLFSLSPHKIANALPKELHIVNQLEEGQSQVIELPIALQTKRYNLHVEQYMREGKTYKLVFITDVHSLLRSEQRHAWQRLIKVMSHEINNSLSPIASISQTLVKIVNKQIDSPIKNSITDNLEFIQKRASDLGKFIESYHQLARLPEPNCQAHSLKELIANCQKPFNDCLFNIIPKDDVILLIDSWQFEQLFINLFKNAQDASAQLKHTCQIDIDWQISNKRIRVHICDNGGGIKNSDNLFVPFYSTKQHGSGIGLVLCQQIAEAHQGRLSLHNRVDKTGCCALLDLPYTAA